MDTSSDAASPSGTNDRSNVQTVEHSSKNLSQETQAKVEALYKEGSCITILVIGRSGTGKSTLINVMFGRDVAEVTHGVHSGTTKVRKYAGTFEGVVINIYDTPGFRDTKGRRERDTLFEIAKHGLFDLILICTKLEDKDDQSCNFVELASYLHKEVWKRAVVVLTFANIFITLESVKKEPDVKLEIKKAIDGHKDHLMTSLSKYGISKEVLDKVPFCLAGVQEERKLPTVDDWLHELWDKCVDRSSDEARHFLSFYARNRGFIEAGSFFGAVGVGAGIGAGIGSIVPVAGTAIGAGIGAAVGGVVSLVGIGLGRIFK